MDRSEIIYLVEQIFVQDAMGVYREGYTQREVFCEVTSVSQSEWFEGSRTGLNPSYRFRMFEPDYAGEKMLKYNGQYYSIYRTYRDKNEIIDLYCEAIEKTKGMAEYSTEPTIFQ